MKLGGVIEIIYSLLCCDNSNVSAMIEIEHDEITIVLHKQVIILAIEVNNSRNAGPSGSDVVIVPEDVTSFGNVVVVGIVAQLFERPLAAKQYFPTLINVK